MMPPQVLPDLGDPRKTWDIALNEPEMNAIAAVTGFVRGACNNARFSAYWNHYGPTLESLLLRLEQIAPDDNNAPHQEPSL